MCSMVSSRVGISLAICQSATFRGLRVILFVRFYVAPFHQQAARIDHEDSVARLLAAQAPRESDPR